MCEDPGIIRVRTSKGIVIANITMPLPSSTLEDKLSFHDGNVFHPWGLIF